MNWGKIIILIPLKKQYLINTWSTVIKHLFKYVGWFVQNNLKYLRTIRLCIGRCALYMRVAISTRIFNMHKLNSIKLLQFNVLKYPIIGNQNSRFGRLIPIWLIKFYKWSTKTAKVVNFSINPVIILFLYWI